MIDLKPDILATLRSNSALVSLVGTDRNGDAKIYPEVTQDDRLPYVTFFEITNFDSKYADDTAYDSEIHFQIDVFTKGNTFPIASEVNRTMESIGFYRTSSADLYEDDTKTFHKVLRYKINTGE